MSIGATMLGRRHVLPSVCSTLTEIMVEGTFPTGTYLVTVHHPISSDDGDLAKALYGSFLPIPDIGIFQLPEEAEYEAIKQPGAVVIQRGKVVLNEGRKRRKLKVTSKGDRPIQVCVLLVNEREIIYSNWHGRLVHITILSRRTHNSNSIESRPTDTDWTSQQEPQSASNPEIQRQ